MLGTIVNVAAILAGAFGGLLFGKALKERYKDVLNQVMGLCVIFVGASGAIAGMLSENANPVLFILALAIGGFLGEVIGIEAKLGGLGDFLQKRLVKKQENNNFSQGFVAASLIFCIGTMAVLGSIDSGTKGDHSILMAKSVIDGITAMVLASTFGVGVAFSAVSIFLYQGAITMLSIWVSPYLSADMLREISIVGGIMIFAIGLNMLKITKIKVGNLLPALIVPIIYYLILMVV